MMKALVSMALTGEAMKRALHPSRPPIPQSGLPISISPFQSPFLSLRQTVT